MPSVAMSTRGVDEVAEAKGSEAEHPAEDLAPLSLPGPRPEPGHTCVPRAG